jgi:hypothetical protein
LKNRAREKSGQVRVQRDGAEDLSPAAASETTSKGTQHPSADPNAAQTDLYGIRQHGPEFVERQTNRGESDEENENQVWDDPFHAPLI